MFIYEAHQDRNFLLYCVLCRTHPSQRSYLRKYAHEFLCKFAFIAFFLCRSLLRILLICLGMAPFCFGLRFILFYFILIENIKIHCFYSFAL